MNSYGALKEKKKEKKEKKEREREKTTTTYLKDAFSCLLDPSQHSLDDPAMECERYTVPTYRWVSLQLAS